MQLAGQFWLPYPKKINDTAQAAPWQLFWLSTVDPTSFFLKKSGTSLHSPVQM
jgi:hypothetical protein